MPVVVGADMTFSWRHRDRLLQADTLVDNSADSIGPEPGTTYTVRATTLDGALVLAERAGVVGNTATIPIGEVNAEQALVEVFSVRDGLESLQRTAWAIEIPIAPISFKFASGPYTPPPASTIHLKFGE